MTTRKAKAKAKARARAKAKAKATATTKQRQKQRPKQVLGCAQHDNLKSKGDIWVYRSCGHTFCGISQLLPPLACAAHGLRSHRMSFPDCIGWCI
jgi:hypothetical protein